MSMSTTTDRQAFELAKSTSLEFLSRMVGFSEEMYRSTQSQVFDAHKSKINGLRSKLKGAIKRCFNEDDLAILSQFARDVIAASNYEDKLSKFYLIAFEYSRAVMTQQIDGIDVQWLNENIQRFRNADDITNEAWQEARKTPFSLLAIFALLGVICARKETYQYILFNYSKTAVGSIQSLAGLDIQDIFSVNFKVPRRDHFETDITAVRVCAAHGYYSIEKREKDHVIHFENNEEGWHFKHDFTTEEFFRFFVHYVTLEGLRIQLLQLAFNGTLMSIYLTKT